MLPLTVMLVSVGIKRMHFRNYQSRALWYRSLFLPWHGRMNIARGASGCANGLKVVTIHHNCLRSFELVFYGERRVNPAYSQRVHDERYWQPVQFGARQNWPPSYPPFRTTSTEQLLWRTKVFRAHTDRNKRPWRTHGLPRNW
jgi:hypothetical protein